MLSRSPVTRRVRASSWTARLASVEAVIEQELGLRVLRGVSEGQIKIPEPNIPQRESAFAEKGIRKIKAVRNK